MHLLENLSHSTSSPQVLQYLMPVFKLLPSNGMSVPSGQGLSGTLAFYPIFALDEGLVSSGLLNEEEKWAEMP